MDDLTSQIVQINEALTIDPSPIESVLYNIVKVLREHDQIALNLPAIETVHSELRKDLTKLKIALESLSAQTNKSDTLLESNAAHHTDSDTCNAPDDKSQNSYGLRKCNIGPIQLKQVEQSDRDKDTAITNGLRDVKAKLRQLQQDRDETLANELEFDRTVKVLKDDVLNIQQKLAASVSMPQLQLLQQSITSKHGQMETHLNNFQSKFREEVRQSINDYLDDIKLGFASLETFLTQRQDKMDARVASCAKEYDVTAFRENVESSIALLTSKASFLDAAARAQGETLVVIQQKNALAMFHRHYSEWRVRAIKLGMVRWTQAVKREVEYEKGKAAQKRLMKKILTAVMSRRKHVGFNKWIKHRNWHRKTERLKINASALVYDRLKHYLTSSTKQAFHKWRRMTVADKMKCGVNDDKGNRDKTAIQLPTDMSHSRLTDQSAVVLRENQYSIQTIIESMKTDAYGSSCALAQELEHIKKHDIATLRREIINGQQSMVESTKTLIDEAVQRIDFAAETFKSSISQRVERCDAQFPFINNQLKELGDLFKSHKAQLENIEETNRQRLDTLFDQNSGLEKRISLVEELARSTSVKVASIATEQSKTTKEIQQLSQVIATNEARRDQESKALREVMDRFGDELLKTKVTLGHTQVHCQSLQEELAGTRHELSNFQEVSQSNSEKIADAMNYPGIRTPTLNRIVGVGHAYETLAKGKNYVPGINVIAPMTSIIEQPLKSSEEKRTREEQVDLPAEITAFAHDYAEWIAYQADHESLLQLIAGTNPDDHVYAEDDTISRRKGLLEELKANLSTELERISYPGAVDLPDETTRGLGLRWEARAIFVARVFDATKAALSKHDSLSVPAQTRLGRTRPTSANVTVCVACDRPMRKRSDRNQQPKEDEESSKQSTKTRSGKCIS